jgi:23S rRNA (uracil1939-C5)-methyltransferase
MYSIENVQINPDNKIKLHSYLKENLPEFGNTEKKEVSSAFAQVNNKVREKLYDWVNGIPFQHHNRLLDGYCGMGDLTHQLSLRFEHTDGVEINKQAVKTAVKAYTNPKLNFYAQPIESFLAASTQRYTAVVLNPPRAGVSQQVCESMIQHKPADIVMVSCHPAALVRDSAKLIEAGYRISSIQPFDMFPQTYHVETVVHYQYE